MLRLVHRSPVFWFFPSLPVHLNHRKQGKQTDSILLSVWTVICSRALSGDLCQQGKDRIEEAEGAPARSGFQNRRNTPGSKLRSPITILHFTVLSKSKNHKKDKKQMQSPEDFLDPWFSALLLNQGIEERKAFLRISPNTPSHYSLPFFLYPSLFLISSRCFYALCTCLNFVPDFN